MLNAVVSQSRRNTCSDDGLLVVSSKHKTKRYDLDRRSGSRERHTRSGVDQSSSTLYLDIYPISGDNFEHQGNPLTIPWTTEYSNIPTASASTCHSFPHPGKPAQAKRASESERTRLLEFRRQSAIVHLVYDGRYTTTSAPLSR
jgi:hypothetical protein